MDSTVASTDIHEQYKKLQEKYNVAELVIENNSNLMLVLYKKLE
jgi:hypothetical protein